MKWLLFYGKILLESSGNVDLVSVIIPVHNNKDYIIDCLNSVINQTYKNLEIIIINDNNFDDGFRKVKDKRIKIIDFDKNVGAARARNAGVKIAKGNYICFLDSDDIWFENKVEEQLNFMKKNDYTFTYTNYVYLRPKGRMHVAKTPTSLTYKQALKNTAILTSTVMFNMNKITKEEIYMPNIKRGHDMATWWRILNSGFVAYGLNKSLTYYRVTPNSLSSNKFKDIKRTWRLYKLENIIFFKRLYYFCWYAFNAVKRRII